MKQWKKPRTRVANLVKLGMPEWQAYRNSNTRKGYWAVAGSGILKTTITNKRLASAGYYSILKRYESVHLYDLTAVYGSVRTVVWEVGHSTNGWPPTRLLKSDTKVDQIYKLNL